MLDGASYDDNYSVLDSNGFMPGDRGYDSSTRQKKPAQQPKQQGFSLLGDKSMPFVGKATGGKTDAQKAAEKAKKDAAARAAAAKKSAADKAAAATKAKADKAAALKANSVRQQNLSSGGGAAGSRRNTPYILRYNRGKKVDKEVSRTRGAYRRRV
jgi:membrane protein involved in colicin uptake